MEQICEFVFDDLVFFRDLLAFFLDKREGRKREQQAVNRIT